ncbi:MAG: ABC transporter ATP-binding protein [Bacteroidetes bacterium]|nr:MAG: ABC transporter ATP-binding protein [Bacteroidota bacterium]
MIRFEHIHKSFGKQEVLKDIELHIPAGGLTALLGPNGSGKTTLVKSLLGLVIPQQGHIYFEGKPIAGKWDYRRHIGYLPQIARFPENLRVHELIRMIQDIRSEQGRPDELIALFELNPFLNARLRNLSGGTRQKVNLLLTLMFDTPLIVLDEPTVGLDPVALVQLKNLISQEKERGKTLLLCSHIMSVVEELADDVIFLLEGRIHFHGSLQSLLQEQGETRLEHAIARVLKPDFHLQRMES